MEKTSFFHVVPFVDQAGEALNEEYNDELCQAELTGHHTKGTKARHFYLE
jgi:hypothetical protein